MEAMNDALGKLPHPLVLYDADCRFCTRSIATLVRRGSAATFRPLSSVDLDRLGVDPHRAVREMPAVLPGGDVVYGAAAFAAALRTGPWWMRWSGFLLRCWPLTVLGAAVYRWVAAHRQCLRTGPAACEAASGAGAQQPSSSGPGTQGCRSPRCRRRG